MVIQMRKGMHYCPGRGAIAQKQVNLQPLLPGKRPTDHSLAQSQYWARLLPPFIKTATPDEGVRDDWMTSARNWFGGR